MSKTKKTPLVLKPEDPFDEAVEVFKRGGIIVYPTETFYALGVDPLNKKAVERLFSLKKRHRGKPLSLIIKDEAMLLDMVTSIQPSARVLMRHFWPGPLTIVFMAKKNIPDAVTAGTKKIGLRISSNPSTQKLLSTLDSPITATSANPSSLSPAVNAAKVMEYFDEKIDLIIDGGRLTEKKGSTVIDVTGRRAKFVRVGAIPKEEILPFIETR